jgi:predicted extracellular nuclease
MTNLKPGLLLSVLLLLTVMVHAQPLKNRQQQIKVVFYNVENLFDTVDDPNKDDKEFLPGASVAWNTPRYLTKLEHTAKVLASIDSISLPEVIGMAEVENIAALQDLIGKTRLKTGNYRAILEEGQDPRGIDVALIYRPDRMKYLGHRSLPSAGSFRTRSALCVTLADPKDNRYHFIVNHWKSRSGGQEETEAQRFENARYLKAVTDSILNKDPFANILLIGDFNDEPTDSSISVVLGAKPAGTKPVPSDLYNLMSEKEKEGEGTLFYKDWDVFDQIIVSGNLLTRKTRKSPWIGEPWSYVFKEDWMLYKHRTGVMVPNRTASSREYFGGYSDHLPVFTVVKF